MTQQKTTDSPIGGNVDGHWARRYSCDGINEVAENGQNQIYELLT